MHGVKESTNDIDLGCTTYLIEQFIRNGCNYKVIEDNNTRIIEIDDKIEVFENWFVMK